MLKPQTEPKELLERIKYLLKMSKSKNCKVKSDVRKEWNNNVDILISSTQIQNLAKDLSKLSNNIIKLNMLIVSIKIIKYFFLIK